MNMYIYIYVCVCTVYTVIYRIIRCISHMKTLVLSTWSSDGRRMTAGLFRANQPACSTCGIAHLAPGCARSPSYGDFESKPWMGPPSNHHLNCMYIYIYIRIYRAENPRNRGSTEVGFTLSKPLKN